MINQPLFLQTNLDFKGRSIWVRSTNLGCCTYLAIICPQSRALKMHAAQRAPLLSSCNENYRVIWEIHMYYAQGCFQYINCIVFLSNCDQLMKVKALGEAVIQYTSSAEDVISRHHAASFEMTIFLPEIGTYEIFIYTLCMTYHQKITKNPSIFNIIRWFDGTPRQKTH